MFDEGIRVLVDGLADADPACCDRDELAGLIRRATRVRAWLDALDARVALRARELADDGRCETPCSLLADEGRRAGRDAQAAATRAEVCAEMPGFHDALAAGAVSAGHVDAVARAAAQLSDAGRSELNTHADSLVSSARAMPVEAFERECRDLARILSRDDGVSRLAWLRQQRRLRRWVDRQTGMCKTLLELDPEADARVSTALSAALAADRAKPQTADTNWDHLQADALVELITGARSVDPRTPELSVLIDLETLRSGLHDQSLGETADGQPLPPETLRRLGCEADIIPLVLGGAGETLDVGRQQRLATRAQRRALRAMYRTCAHPGCQVAFDHCRIHHATWWDHHGPTDLANLIPLCSEHHHLVHEGGWTLTLHPDRTIALHRPDATLFFEGSTVDRTSTTRRAEVAGSLMAADGDRAPPPGVSDFGLHVLRNAPLDTQFATTAAAGNSAGSRSPPNTS
jgi:hypothetical protein